MTAQWLPLPGFERVGEVPSSSIERFRNSVPEGIVELWATGTGFVGDGFLRVIDPAEYVEVLEEGLLQVDGAVPVFVTAFGDVLYWREIVSAAIFRKGVTQGVVRRLELLRRFIEDPTFATSYLKAPLWPAAKEALGTPDFDECFGFVPLLALGGPERLENVKRVALREHLSLLVQASGPLAG